MWGFVGSDIFFSFFFLNCLHHFCFAVFFWLDVGCFAWIARSIIVCVSWEGVCVHIRLYILFCPSTPVEFVLLLVSASVDITTHYTRYIPAYIITYIPTSLGRECLAQQ